MSGPVLPRGYPSSDGMRSRGLHQFDRAGRCFGLCGNPLDGYPGGMALCGVPIGREYADALPENALNTWVSALSPGACLVGRHIRVCTEMPHHYAEIINPNVSKWQDSFGPHTYTIYSVIGCTRRFQKVILRASFGLCFLVVPVVLPESMEQPGRHPAATTGDASRGGCTPLPSETRAHDPPREDAQDRRFSFLLYPYVVSLYTYK